MWLIARILISFGALVYKLFFRRIPKEYGRRHGDLLYAQVDIYGRTTRILKRYYETPVQSAFICVLSKETGRDRFFKAIGFGGELQTEDPSFDRMVYVLGDHPLTEGYLTSSATARSTILKLISQGVTSISVTGESLRVEVPGEFNSSTLLDDIAILVKELHTIQGDVRSRFADPNYDTALIIQAIFMSALVYGGVGLFEAYTVKVDYHLDIGPLIQLGLWVTGGFIAVTLGMVWLLLRRSSYAPRLMTENVFLCLLLPFSGFQVASDINRSWDASPGWVVSYRVDSVERVYHSRRRKRSYYTYHAHISPLTPTTVYPVSVPRDIRIEHELYEELSTNKQIRLEIGEGALGVPWYREMWAGPP